MAQRRRRDVERRGAAAREVVTAVLPATERHPGRADRALGDQRCRRGPLHRRLDLELRQIDAEMAQEQGGPGAGRQDHGAAAIDPRSVSTCDTLPASVSSERTAQPSRIVAPARSAARASAGTARAGSARASLGVNRRAQEAPPVLPEHRVGLGGRQHPRFELVVLRMRQPGREAGELVLGLGQIGRRRPCASRCPPRSRPRSAPTAAAPGCSPAARAGRGPACGSSPSCATTARRRSAPSRTRSPARRRLAPDSRRSTTPATPPPTTTTSAFKRRVRRSVWLRPAMAPRRSAPSVAACPRADRCDG